ncbi:hypothetical protein BGW80DRAFT_849900 [Lactifluus volemus]|nr:hypothetical protein BGW80DRAFT_849900 [Lactifluus volemus]
MDYIAQEEDFYSVGLWKPNLSPDPPSPDTALSSPYMDPTPNQQTTACLYTGSMHGFLGQDIHAECQEELEGYIGTEQNMSFDNNPEGYDENDPSFDKSLELTGYTIALCGTTTSSAEPDGTHFIQNHHDGPTTLPLPSSEQPQRDLDNVPHSSTWHVYLQPANIHPSENADSDAEEYDGYDSTTLAESPESTGGIIAYGGTTASSLMVDDTQYSQEIDKWAQSILESSKVQCLKCDNTILYAMKGFRRHFDDLHVDPKKCPKCPRMIIGQRKLKAHLERDHGHDIEMSS